MAHPTDFETRRSRRERSEPRRSSYAEPLPTRRELREAERRGEPREAERRGPSRRRHSPAVYRRRRIVAGALALVLVTGTVAGVVGVVGAIGNALAGGSQALADAAAPAETVVSGPPRATAIPAPTQSGQAAPPTASGTTEAGAVTDPCVDPAVQQALDGGSDADVIAAAGGAERFRAAIAAGAAPCIDLFEPGRSWVVVNKQHALQPIDYAPEQTVWAEGVQRTGTEQMRPDVAAALSQLVGAARADGAGEIGVNSAFRGYDYQAENHDGFVRELGRDDAELTSARPGHSEHQTGLAVDLVACGASCGGIRDFGGTAQAQWVAENAWRYGFIVRYDEGQTEATGYEWEPWHLRYVGTELASAYTEGGYRTLESFFGLPAAPDYPA